MTASESEHPAQNLATRLFGFASAWKLHWPGNCIGLEVTSVLGPGSWVFGPGSWVPGPGPPWGIPHGDPSVESPPSNPFLEINIFKKRALDYPNMRA